MPPIDAADHLLALASATPAARRGALLLAAGRHLTAARGAHPRRLASLRGWLAELAAEGSC
jgi:hypothetical protein